MKFDSSVVKRVSNDVKDTNTTLLSSFSLGIFYLPVYPVGILQSISLGTSLPPTSQTEIVQSISLGMFFPPASQTEIIQSVSLGRTGWNDDLGKFERHQGDIVNYKY